jgi:hypothetical protein
MKTNPLDGNAREPEIVVLPNKVERARNIGLNPRHASLNPGMVAIPTETLL